MSDPDRMVTEPLFIAVPRDANLRALYEYWNMLRGDRAMPRRADIDPVEIPKLLPYLVMYTVAPGGGGYTIRLVGEEIVGFAGRSAVGLAAGATMPPRAAEILHDILDAVATERLPKFRAGKAHWQPDKSYRDFEACFLPLSADGEAVDIILCGISFSGFREPDL
jgi:hypothetical protein